MAVDDPVNRGMTDPMADDLGMLVDVMGRPAHRPTTASRQRALTIESNQPQTDVFGKP